jgi:hypothetical protein
MAKSYSSEEVAYRTFVFGMVVIFMFIAVVFIFVL